MYHGKMTKELKKLYKEYSEKWNGDPGTYDDLDYGADEYDDYVADIKKALELGIELPDLFPDGD